MYISSHTSRLSPVSPTGRRDALDPSVTGARHLATQHPYFRLASAVHADDHRSVLLPSLVVDKQKVHGFRVRLPVSPCTSGKSSPLRECALIQSARQENQHNGVIPPGHAGYCPLLRTCGFCQCTACGQAMNLRKIPAHSRARLPVNKRDSRDDQKACCHRYVLLPSLLGCAAVGPV